MYKIDKTTQSNLTSLHSELVFLFLLSDPSSMQLLLKHVAVEACIRRSSDVCVVVPIFRCALHALEHRTQTVGQLRVYDCIDRLMHSANGTPTN